MPYTRATELRLPTARVRVAAMRYDAAMPVTFERIVPVFPVRDVRAALEHYRKLGFEADAYDEDDGNGPIYGFVSVGAIEIHLSRVADLDPSRNTSACYVYVDDAAALYAQWRATDVEGRLGPPEDTEYGLREMHHVDPDGNLLRIGSPLPGRS